MRLFQPMFGLRLACEPMQNASVNHCSCPSLPMAEKVSSVTWARLRVLPVVGPGTLNRHTYGLFSGPGPGTTVTLQPTPASSPSHCDVFPVEKSSSRIGTLGGVGGTGSGGVGGTGGIGCACSRRYSTRSSANRRVFGDVVLIACASAASLSRSTVIVS